jgi:hypothetical protein
MLYYYKLKGAITVRLFRFSIARIGSKFKKIDRHNSKHPSSR